MFCGLLFSKNPKRTRRAKNKREAQASLLFLVHRKGLVTLLLPPVLELVATTVRRTVALNFSSPFLLYVRKKADTHMGICFFGTPEGTRTPNPRNRNPMLYPLSHRCICFNSLNIIARFSAFVKGWYENIFALIPPFSAKPVVFPAFLCYNAKKD